MHFPTLAIVSAILVSAVTVAAEPKTVDVVMLDFPFLPRFNPISVTINVGDTVRWTNKGTIPHTVDAGENCFALLGNQAFTSGIVVQTGVFTYTFDKPGVFPYFCKPHCVGGSMTGTVIVK